MTPDSLLVCGSRSWDDVDTVIEALSRAHAAYGRLSLIHESRPGAERIAAKTAATLRWNVLGIPTTPVAELTPSLTVAFLQGRTDEQLLERVQESLDAGVPTVIYERNADGTTVRKRTL